MRKRVRLVPDRKTTFLGVLWWLIKFPYQALAVFMALCMLLGWICLISLPLGAYTSNSDPFFFMLRCFDFKSDRAANPLFLLERQPLQNIAYDLRKPEEPGVKRAMTPEVVRESKRLVQAMWDMNDPAQRERVQAWGASLMQLGLAAARKPSRKLDLSVAATEEEAWVMVSMALLGLHPHQVSDLYQLEQLAEKAYPAPADREAALAWAGTLYDRLERFNQSFQTDIDAADQRNESRVGHQRIQAVLPPRTTKTLWWLVYQYVGLTPQTRQQAADHWPTFFSSVFREDAQNLGEEIERERRAAGEPLPPSCPALPWLCLVERYLGLDQKGERDRRALQAFYSPSSRRLTAIVLEGANPNDEYFYILAGGNTLHLIEEKVGGDAGYIVLIILLVVYGFRIMVFTVIAEWILRLHHNPAYRYYRNGRGHGHFSVRLVGYVVVPLIAWGLSFYLMPGIVRPLAGSAGAMLLAAFLSVLLGGVFVGFMTRMTALLFLRFGIDVNRVWWDEIIGLTVGLGLLAYFGNDAFNLAIFALAELLPMALQPREPEVLDVVLVGEPA